MSDIDALIERLDSHMGKADMGEVLADCRLAAQTILALREALQRISKLTPITANAPTAEDFAATVHAITDSALATEAE